MNTDLGPRRARDVRIDLPVSSGALLRLLLAVSVALVTVSLLLNVAEALGWDNPPGVADRLLDVDREQSISAWFSSSSLLVAALLALSEAARRWGDVLPLAWLVTAGVFLLLSADESLAVHEYVGYKLERALDTGGPLRFAFVIPGSLLVAVGAFFLVRLLRRVDPATARCLAVGAGVFVAGALGLGAIADSSLGETSLLYAASVSVEELLEMTGVAVVVFALARLASGSVEGRR